MVDKEKIDEMIEYFGTEKSKTEHLYSLFLEEGKSALNITLTMCTICASIAVGLFAVGLVVLGGILVEFILVIALIGYSLYYRNQNKRLDEYISRVVSLDMITAFLQNLKITDYKVSLEPLMEKFKQYHRDKDTLDAILKKGLEWYEDKWLDEFIRAFDIIDKEIREIKSEEAKS